MIVSPLRPRVHVRSRRALPRTALRAVTAPELLRGLANLPASQDAGGKIDGIAGSVLVSGVEYARATVIEEARLRAAWKRREGGGATPLVLFADDPDSERVGFVRVLGPQREGPLRRVRADSLLELVRRTLSMERVRAVRLIAEELDRLDVERVAGLRVRGLGTEHLYGKRLPSSPKRWRELETLVEGVSRAGWRELLSDLGYTIEQLRPAGYLAKFGGRPAIVIYPRANAWLFARFDDEGRLPEGALVEKARALGAPYGILAAGSRLRLLAAGVEQAGAATSYLELDAAVLEPDLQPLLGLLSPRYLVEGEFATVLTDARDYGQALRQRLDRVLRQDVLPVIGRELGHWARSAERDIASDEVREEIEAAALLFVFRALFLLYAESAGHLPMANPTYHEKSLTRICARAYEERDAAETNACALWDDIAALVRRMRTGHAAWELPAYNGDLFAKDAVAGAEELESASISDAALGPALVALARDEKDGSIGIDFSSLEIGHLGYIYEGLLSLRLSLADRDYDYDARSDRYVEPAPDVPPDVRAGELLWLTNEGGRKSSGVYYTRTELVRHLVKGAVGPAYERHLQEVRALAAKDPAAAAQKAFDFYVLDPACGSAHFLVEVVDEITGQLAALLGETALPAIRAQIERLRAKAAAYGTGVEDPALLKRLVLKRCVYGVDLSPMGVEIAKVSLWLSTFVPGLSLAYLDHNVQLGNSLIGVANVTDVGEGTLFGDALSKMVGDAAEAAAKLRTIDDTTPEQVAASRQVDRELREREIGARRLFNLWTAEPLGLAGTRDEAERQGAEVLSGVVTPMSNGADELARRERFLHWPLAFAEVFARERPGFDAVVGNPPWEEVTVEELGFYARYSPGIRALPQRAREAALAELIEQRPELAERLEDAGLRAAALRGYFSRCGDFYTSPGDPDTYKLFSQRYRQLLREEGRMGVVLPRSVFVARGSAAFREWLFDNAPPDRIDFLLNNRKWAFDIHPQYSVSLLVARRGGPSDDFEVAGVAASVHEFVAQVDCAGLRLRRDALGMQLEVPLLPTQEAADLLAKLRSTEQLPLGGGRWLCFPVRELDESNDVVLWRGATSGRPLWKGESFDQYSPRGIGQRICPETDDVITKVRKPRPGAGSAVAERTSVEERRRAVMRSIDRSRVAFRDVSRATDSRTVRACLVPPKHFLTNKAPYLAFVDDNARAEAACLATLNSLPFDWQARRFVEINLNFFILEGLRIPPLDDETFEALATDAARLSCVDDRFKDFAAATGVEYGPLSDDEREELRADIDARVARAWKLTPEELEIVFSDFTLDAVPEAYRDRVRARFADLR
jgi:hypothetical protein